MDITKYNQNNFVTQFGNAQSTLQQEYTNSLTDNTKRAYAVDIIQFFALQYPQVESLDDVTIDMMKNVNSATARLYTNYLKTIGNDGKPYALSSTNRKLTALSSFYSFLCRQEVGIMTYNPFDTKQGASRVKQNKQYSNTRCLTIEEIQAMDKVASKCNNLEGLRNRIIILILFTTGVRRDEITSIKIGGIEQSGGKWLVEVIGKGEKPRLVVITDTIKMLIDKYITARGLSYKDRDRSLWGNHSSNAEYWSEDGISDDTIYAVVKRLAKRAGLDKRTISPHCFRHSYATESIELGLPIQDVADLMGHSDISTTKRYAHTNRVVTHNPAQILENKLFNISTSC